MSDAIDLKAIEEHSRNPFKIAQAQLREANRYLNLAPGTLAALMEPLRELHVSLPIKMDDGSVKVFKGFRVQYNDARGPNKGGIICDPKSLSAGELERLSRQYVRQVGRIIGLDKDIPAPDVYTNPQIMAWMMDEYYWQKGYNEPGAFTGKPIEVGGSLGRGDATARGGIFCTREAMKVLGLPQDGNTYAIQGFGNAGQHAATLMKEILGEKNKLVAVSDSKGGVYSEEGFNPAQLIEHKMATGSVVGFPGATAISNAELLELEVDVIFPSALENVITGDNAPRIKARISCELANGPTTPEGDSILCAQNTFVIPDFLANAGGVTVSYFEQVQNGANYFWSIEEVHERLDQKMTKAFHDVYREYKGCEVNMRIAAYIVAVRRVARAMEIRGWV